MRARVGSTCIRRYGPRYAWTQNPDHVKWQSEVAEAEAVRAQAQRELDAKLESDLREHPTQLAEWESELHTANGVERRARRRQIVVWGIPCAASVIFVGLGLALGG